MSQVAELSQTDPAVPPVSLSAEPVARVNLLGLTREQLGAWFSQIGEKPFRATQVMKWIHQYGVTDFAQMTNLSAQLRGRLAELAEVRAPEVVHRQYSQDGTRKWVFRVGDGAGSLIETVLIPASDKTGDRKTLCISSQVG